MPGCISQHPAPAPAQSRQGIAIQEGGPEHLQAVWQGHEAEEADGGEAQPLVRNPELQGRTRQEERQPRGEPEQDEDHDAAARHGKW